MSITRQQSTRGVHSVVGWLYLLGCLLSLSLGSANASLLSDYVAQPDPSYSYATTGVTNAGAYNIHRLEMTSQTWNPTGAGGTVWKHALAVVVPTAVTSQTAMVILGSGTNDAPLSVPTSQVQLAVQIALASKTIVAVVGQLPNQPLFSDVTPGGYSEDALVAYTWDRAMGTGDYTWSAYVPMTKAAVRALDTVQSYLPGATGKSVDDFVVVGFSKRGAITWLTAAIDSRVRALAPGVFDFLNMAPQIEHHFSAYGFYTPAVVDYVNFDIVRRFRTPEGQALLAVIDPYDYRDLLTKPKFLINSSGDQFFLPDSARYYLADVTGETRVRYVPNTDHSLSTAAAGVQDALLSLLGWYHSILADTPRASLSWVRTGNTLVVTADQPVLAARRWSAVNPDSRDFRRETIGEAWSRIDLTAEADGSFVVELDTPTTGWAAGFLEFVFAGPAGVPQTYSTPIFISPDTLPFKVTDPIGDPHGVGYWKRRVRSEIEQGVGGTIAGYLPFPVLGRYVTSLADASDILEQRGDLGQALKHCLATRLNISSRELGWYTEVGRRGTRRYLWQHWQSAYDAYQLGRTEKAADICERLNEQ